METTPKLKQKTVLSITLIYFVANFLILLNRGAWWDGLRILTFAEEGNIAGIWTHLSQFLSYPLFYLIRLAMYSGDSFIIVMKSAVFLTWLISTLLLYAILRKIIALSDRDSFFIACCFALFPAFPFKGEIIYLVFSLGITLFFAGILMYFSAQQYTNVFSRYSRYAASAILFFGAFWNRAILVFYGGFLILQIYQLYREHNKGTGEKLLRTCVRWGRANYFFILLPILFWLFHESLGKPYNIGEGYTKLLFFEPGFLRLLLDNAWSYIAYGLGWPLLVPFSILDRRLFAILFLAVSALVFTVMRKTLNPPSNGDTGAEQASVTPRPRYYIAAGILWFILGALPYLAVGQYLSIYGDGFHMRYAILIPLGASLIIAGLVYAIVKERTRPAIQMLIISAFITYSIFNYFMLDMDWYRQKAVTLSLRETQSAAIQSASTLAFHDNLNELKYMGRSIKTGDLTITARRAFYPERFVFALAMDVGDVSPGETVPDAIREHFKRLKTYGAIPVPEDFDPLKKVVEVEIVSTSEQELMTVANWLKLKRTELFADEETFNDALRKELRIQVLPLAHE